MKKYIKPSILLIFIVAAIYVGKFTGAKEYITRDMIEHFIGSMGVVGPLAFILVYVLGTIFFFPGTPITILGGILFGAVLGTTYAVIGATLGSAIAFTFSRYLGKDFIDKILKDKFKGINKYDKKLEDHGFITTLFLRLIPLFPFNGLNFALGLTKTKFKDFILATAIGIIPGSFILAFFWQFFGYG